jgi:hypothetical protein
MAVVLKSLADGSGIIPPLGGLHRYETEWEGFRLVVEERPQLYWQAFVYDPRPAVLYTAARMSLDASKTLTVEYVSAYVFGPGHNLKSEVVTAMLVWEPVEP